MTSRDDETHSDGFMDLAERLSNDVRAAIDLYKNEEFAAAVAVFTSCANAGDPTACIYLAQIYRNGDGVPKDGEIQKMWLRRLADLADMGNLVAQWELSNIYRFGSGLNSDLGSANRWLERAARAGQPDAMCQMYQYLNIGGSGFPQDKKLALEMLTGAVAKGHPEGLFYWSQYFYVDGKPTPKAIQLLKQSVAGGFGHALETLEQLGIQK